ncbi:hypothetical protein K9L16_00860 [Candidatus Pacearchaeota archaeon]|nr:hypothetical protein [Candidatus Pacearchaeota archaeon]
MRLEDSFRLGKIKQNLPEEDLKRNLDHLKSLLDTGFIGLVREGAKGERPSWDEKGMMEAILVSTWATCYNVQSGSAIIFNKRVIGKGYNGAPAKVESCFQKGSCYKESLTGKKFENTMNTNLCRGAHSEKNALFNMVSKPEDYSSILYTTVFPCHTCTKDLLASRVPGRIVFARFYDLREFPESVKMFNEAGINLDYFPISRRRINELSKPRIKAKFSVFNS